MSLTLKQDFTKSTLAAAAIIGPTLTFTRSGAAEAFDSAGVLQTIATGVARTAAHTYDGAAWINRGVLMEQSRTNICLFSEDATDAVWVNTNTDNPTTNNASVDGASTADELSATSTNDQAFADYQAFTGLTATDETTVSRFLKSGTGATKAQLVFDSDGSGSDGFFANFDLSAGTVDAGTAIGSGTVIRTQIEDVADGWYRCSVTGTISAETVGRFTTAIIDNASAAVFEAANLTDNDSIIVWGGHIEAGAADNDLTSYIPTPSSSTVTRNAENLNDQNVDTSGWIDTAQSLVGTWILDVFKQIILGTQVNHIMTVDDGVASQQFKLREQTSGRVNWDSDSSGGDDFGIDSNASEYVIDKQINIVVTYADLDIAIAIDGTLGETSATGDLPIGAPTNMTDLNVGGFVGSTIQINGFIKHLRYYDERKTNGFLENPDAFDVVVRNVHKMWRMAG